MAPKKNDKGKKKSSEKGPSFTADKLIEQGNVALSNMELELAEKFFSRALTMAPQDTNIMDALADVQIQIGEPEKAIKLLLQSTSVAPNENPFKWFFLGQLQTDIESVNSYRTGIQLLTALLDVENEADARRALEKQIAKAHSSITEIYLTDLCYDEDAEAVCEREVAAALTVCPDSLDGLQTRASLRLSQKRKEEASAIIAEVFARVMHIRQVVSARTVVEEMSGAAEPQEFQDLPEMEFALATVKLLIECAGVDPSLYSKALDLGSDLLQEDDENVELWYLMGVASLGGLSPAGACGSEDAPPAGAAASGADAAGTVDFAGALYHFGQAQEMLDRLREEAAEQGEPNAQFLYQEQYDLVQQHQRLIAAHTSDGAGAQTGAAPVDEEWGDDDEEEGGGSGMVVDK